MRRTLFTLGILAVSLSGCMSPAMHSWLSGDGTIYVLVQTEPEGATVSFPDGTLCDTPCRVGVVEPIEMTIARIGYAPKTLTLTVRSPSPMIIPLTPVSTVIDVEDVELPDL